jgi:hypothetical protein
MCTSAWAAGCVMRMHTMLPATGQDDNRQDWGGCNGVVGLAPSAPSFASPGFRRKTGSTLGYYPPTLRGGKPRDSGPKGAIG